jgi:hypothetical protein
VSSLLPISHSVPQGAILSPLLFSIYVNNLSYVDDSFLIKDLDQATINLEEDLVRVANWCSTNQLLPNPSKTKFILIGTRQLLQRLPKEISLTFLGEVIKPVTSASDLGVTLDTHAPHIWLPHYQSCFILYVETMPDQPGQKQFRS